MSIRTVTESTRRDLARTCFAAAVAAADPERAVAASIDAQPLPAPGPGGRTIVIAFGKAAPAMMTAALPAIDGPVVALCVTHHENDRDVPGIRVLRAGHPVPDQAGYDAGQEVIALLDAAGPQDVVVALISGGGSALLPAPAEGTSLQDKIALNKALLAGGLDIMAMNLVRQQVSELKGGGFLRHAAPARVAALILSDVIGDDLRAIASGPTVAPLGTREEARALLERTGAWAALPDPIRTHLGKRAPDTTLPPVENRLVGSNRLSIEAACAAAQEAGWQAQIASDGLTGDVADAAETVLAAGAATPRDAPNALVFGGETTVVLKGAGLGGRNQEMALRVALEGDRLGTGWTFLSGGTDGRDGPTDAAGGLVDAGTRDRIVAAGGDVDALLANNDSNAALNMAGDLLITGATGTNVADIQILLLDPAHSVTP